jgi:hypothetical protein
MKKLKRSMKKEEKCTKAHTGKNVILYHPLKSLRVNQNKEKEVLFVVLLL